LAVFERFFNSRGVFCKVRLSSREFSLFGGVFERTPVLPEPHNLSKSLSLLIHLSLKLRKFRNPN